MISLFLALFIYGNDYEGWKWTALIITFALNLFMIVTIGYQIFRKYLFFVDKLLFRCERFLGKFAILRFVCGFKENSNTDIGFIKWKLAKKLVKAHLSVEKA